MKASLRPADILAAVTPSASALTLAEWNHLVAIGCALLGAAYLLWRWRREARTPPHKR